MLLGRVAVAGYVSVTPRQRAISAALVAMLYALVLVLIAFWPRGAMGPSPVIPPAVAVFVPTPVEPPVAAPAPLKPARTPRGVPQPASAKPSGPPLAATAPAAATAPIAVDATPVVSAQPVAIAPTVEGTGRSEVGVTGSANGTGQGGGGTGSGSAGTGNGGGGGSLVRAEWARQLDWNDIRPYHPRRAWEKGLSGKASLTCYVRLNQRAYGCVATSEEPAGEGFGAAAVAMERRFRIKPRHVNGKPIDGGQVFFTVNFYTLNR